MKNLAKIRLLLIIKKSGVLGSGLFRSDLAKFFARENV